MKIQYETPVRTHNYLEFSKEVEKAICEKKLAGKLDHILSPVCIVLSAILSLMAPFYIVSESKYSWFLNLLGEIPLLSSYVKFSIGFGNGLSALSIPPEVSLLIIAILVPVLICLVTGLIFRQLNKAEVVSPVEGETNMSLCGKLVCDQVDMLQHTQIDKVKDFWAEISAGIIVLLSAIYVVCVKNSAVGIATDSAQFAFIAVAACFIIGLLSFFVIIASVTIVKKICGIRPNFNIRKLKSDAVEFRLSVDIDSILMKAIKNESFHMNYQPLYQPRRNGFYSAEALARLRNSLYGNIPPTLFIEAAETGGYITKITDVIVRKVCKFIKSEEFQATGLQYITINLSVMDCLKEERIHEIMGIIDEFEVPHHNIGFEVTESATGSSLTEFWNNIDILSKSGFTVFLDDFGSGYSSLSKVISEAFSVVKIDRSLVTDKRDANKRTMLLDVVNMLKHLDKGIVMEGVETKEQVEFMKELDIDIIQGYFYSRPLEENDFVALLTKGTANRRTV